MRIRPWRDAIWNLGHEVVSTWLDEVARPPSVTQEEFYRKLAIKDLCEIAAAELVIIDTAEITQRGGRENEFGFALGQHQKKLIWIVGPARSVFHQLADTRFNEWNECIGFLQVGYDPGDARNTATGSLEPSNETRFGETAVRFNPTIPPGETSGSLYNRSEEVRRPELATRDALGSGISGINLARNEVLAGGTTRPRGQAVSSSERVVVRNDSNRIRTAEVGSGRPSNRPPSDNLMDYNNGD